MCITGAAGQIAYSLVVQIASGRMLGSDQPLILHLLEVPQAEGALHGVVMELEDCALPLVEKIVATVNPEQAFDQVDVAIFVGAFPRKEGMERKDLLEKNAAIFHSQGALLAKYASPNVKVVVVGNPANTNCLLLMRAAGGSIPAENFTCLTRLDHNRGKAQVAEKLQVPVSSVSNVVIWGNHSATQYPYLGCATVKDYPQAGISLNAAIAIGDDKWTREYFIPTVQKRGAAVIQGRFQRMSPLCSSLTGDSKLASSHQLHLLQMLSLNTSVTGCWELLRCVEPRCGIGTSNLKEQGEIVSMGVPTDGSYGVPMNLVFSFPVTCAGGKYEIVQGLPLDEFSHQKIQETTKELVEERDTAIAFVERK